MMTLYPQPSGFMHRMTLLPFFVSMIAALMVITCIPATSLWLPANFMQLKQADVDKAHL